MKKYILREYKKGVEADQARVGIEVARKWIWPFAYDQDDLMKIHSQPDFDPDTRLYCYLGDEMIGYMFSQLNPGADGGTITASLEFPRMLPGHTSAAELLMERSFDILKGKGVSRVVGRLTSMSPVDIRLAEGTGFSISPWGYKVYYSYEMRWGKLRLPEGTAGEIEPLRDLEACAELASRWYLRPPEWCLARLQELHNTGIITHQGVLENGRLIAACLAAPNTLRPSTAANYYIFSPDEQRLKLLLEKVIEKCIGYGTHTLIADLINEHRQYERLYQ